MKAEAATASVHDALVQLAGLSDPASREAFLSHHPELLQPDVVERLAESVRHKVRVHLGEALRLAEAAEIIGRRVGHDGALARGLRAKANALHFLGQNKLAARLHEQAAGLFEREGNTVETGRTLSASIQPLILLGDYGRALDAARRAQEIFSQRGDKLRLARLEINVGNILLRQGKFRQALPRYQRAFEQLYPLRDKEGIASALHNAAVCLISLNDFRRALAAYKRARAFCRKHRMPLAVVQADYNIAYLHYLRGDYTLAIEMLRVTRQKAEEVGDAYHAALCRLDLADIYLELNLIAEAAETGEEALQRFQHLGMRYEAAKALTCVAVAMARKGDARPALEMLARARAMFTEEGNGVWVSLLDLYRARILLGMKRYDQARSLCAKAMRLFQASCLPSRVILCRLMLAQSHLHTGNISRAEQESRRTLRAVSRAETPSLASKAHLVAGQIQEAKHNLPAAYASYQQARKVLEALGSNLHRDDLRIGYAQSTGEVYERLVELCLQRDPNSAVETIFGYVEEAKSRSLRDLVSRHGHAVLGKSSVHSKILRRVHELREELNWYYHRLDLEQLNAGRASRERRQHLQVEAMVRERELLKALRDLPDPHAGVTESYQCPVISLAELRATLPTDTTLVEFFRVRDRFLAVVIAPARSQVCLLGQVSRVEASMALLQFQLSTRALGPDGGETVRGDLLRATQGHLRALYEQLVTPLEHLLQTPHVTFVAHGRLHYLPFHALYDGQRSLIDSHTISYAPSASVLASCHRRRARVRGAALVLGIPDAQAPRILEEVEAVVATLPGAQLFVGENASEERLREQGPTSTLIHIATHACFRQDNPLFSRIRLGTSYLNVLDLYHLNLPARMITLSGCATGMSAVAGGDELLGLARGFLSAGAQSLLLGLWDVNDLSTARFMTYFYSRLNQGADQASAVRSAMTALREEYAHPYYWAPFVLVGKVG